MVSMRTAIVYAIRNLRTGKFYVGSTWDLQGRWDGHRKALAAGDHSPKLQAAWDATEPTDWEWTVLEEGIPITNQFASEQHWITALDAYENGYNSSPRAGSFVSIRREGIDYVLEREADVQRMLRQIESKRPYRNIAADFGVSVGFLAKLKQANGELLVELDAARSAQRVKNARALEERRARKQARAQRELRARELLSDGRSYREVAAELGCSVGTVANIAQRIRDSDTLTDHE
jgi:uncharacterized protein YerC